MSKGSRREREAVELYQQAGMGTYRPATVQYGENDLMGLFDLLAFSPAHRRLHAVQVKSNKARGIQGWQRHTTLFRRLGFRTFYLIPYDNMGWRLVECKDECRRTVVDEREQTGVFGDGITRWLAQQRGES